MAKDESPSDLTKLPNANLFGNIDSRGGDAYADKSNVKSSQNTKMLDYFNALSDMERVSILENLRADNKQEQFMRGKTMFPNPYPVKVEATTEEIRRLNSMTASCRRSASMRLPQNMAQAQFFCTSLAWGYRSLSPLVLKEISRAQESSSESKSMEMMLLHARKLKTR
jgi:hypothetical protein